jgi:hypothetical protein
MALQTHSAALHALKTLKLSGAGPLASATLKATIEAALAAAPYSMAAADIAVIIDRVKHADLLVVTGPIYMADCGDAATADQMSYGTGEKREIRNCRELLITAATPATIYAPGAYDVRVELYS